MSFCETLHPGLRKKAFVSPIYEKDDPEDPENYRSYSITGEPNNVFEKFLFKQINEYLLSRNLLSSTQFGFRWSYSTIDVILFCTEYFRKATDTNNHAAC